MECRNCGSTKITEGVILGHGTEVGNLGPKYKIGILQGIERMFVDICEDCGEIVRQYIRPTKKRNWYKK